MQLLGPSVTKLICEGRFNQRLYFLPSSLTHLVLGDHFNLIIHTLPSSLSTLRIGDKFNHPISCLPSSLTQLRFGESFNSSPFPLPDNLKTLSFGSSFNVPLDQLPAGLVELYFGDNSILPLKIDCFCDAQSLFNHPLPPLPHTLTTLSMGQSYNHLINAEGTSLQTFCGAYHLLRPASLTHVVAQLNVTLPIPASLTHLHLFNVKVTSPIQWPANLIYFSFGKCDISFAITQWPSKLQHLQFEPDVFFNFPLINLPPTLKVLELYCNFNQPLPSLPSNLTLLHFGPKFNQPMDNLPMSLTKLNFGTDFNQSVDNLPPFLRKLSFGSSFNQPLVNLPATLKCLDLSACNNFSFPLEHLPSSLQKLRVSPFYPLKVSYPHNSLKVASLPIISINDIPSSVSTLRCSVINHQTSNSMVSLPCHLKSLLIDVPGFLIIIDLKERRLALLKNYL